MPSIWLSASLSLLPKRSIGLVRRLLLPYLTDEGICFLHYFANRVKRQFRLDQDMPDDFTIILESTTSVQPFLRPNAFEFWSKHFTAITISSSQKEGFCTTTMHRY